MFLTDSLRLVTSCVALFVCCGACAPGKVGDASQRPVRSIEGQTVSSTALPPVQVEVDSSFRYVGRIPFTIRDVAAGERIVFADHAGNQIHRLFVLQFEGILPESDEIYRYDFSLAREIAGMRWRSNAFAYAVTELEPDSEAAAMHRWLAEQGYVVPDVLLMYRFLTLGDERRKDELILFHLEATSDGSWLDEMEGETPRWKELEVTLEANALNVFQVRPYVY